MKNKAFYTIIAASFIASVLFWGFMFQDRATETTEEPPDAASSSITLTMYHGEGCMCCVRWAEYLEENGITVIDELVDDLYEVKKEYGVPGQLGSCHTAVVDGYVVEGHVPAEDIRRLLEERPDAIGISVPGMPPNAPGMDIPVEREFSTFLFGTDEIRVFNTHQ